MQRAREDAFDDGLRDLREEDEEEEEEPEEADDEEEEEEIEPLSFFVFRGSGSLPLAPALPAPSADDMLPLVHGRGPEIWPSLAQG